MRRGATVFLWILMLPGAWFVSAIAAQFVLLIVALVGLWHFETNFPRYFDASSAWASLVLPLVQIPVATLIAPNHKRQVTWMVAALAALVPIIQIVVTHLWVSNAEMNLTGRGSVLDVSLSTVAALVGAGLGLLIALRALDRKARHLLREAQEPTTP